MSKNNGLPCKVCGANDWNNDGKCRPCKRKRDSVYRNNNAEKVSLRKKEYRVNNADKVREGYLRWLLENKDKKSQADKRWALTNPNKVRENHKRWRAKDENKAKVNKITGAWREKNKEKSAQQGRSWSKRNKDKANAKTHARRARKINAPGNGVSAEQENQLKKDYCGICPYCGKAKKLELEHIIPLYKGGAHDVENVTVACKSCNSEKGAKSLVMFLYRRVQLASQVETR